MIIDYINNVDLYKKIDKKMVIAFKYLLDIDFSKVDPGKYEIDGNNIYSLVQEYKPYSKDEGVWESHHNYIDIQYMFQGKELMGYANQNQLKVTQKYDENSDRTFYAGDGDYFVVNQGMFAVFFPEDAHMPCVAVDKPETIKKVVIKVLKDRY